MNAINVNRILILIFCCITSLAKAQVYIDGGKTRHRFAQSNYGMVHKFYGYKSGSLIFSDGSREALETQQDTRIVIGGQHFWGHADFLISIPVFRTKNATYSSRVETAFRYFPWRVQESKLRPYLGAAFIPASFYKGDGAQLYWIEFPLSTGIVYQKKSLLVELGTAWNGSTARSYYVGKSDVATFQAPRWHFSLGLKWIFDSTLSAEQSWQSGKTARLTDTLAKLNRLNGLTLAVGPSSAFYLKDSPLNQGDYAFFHQHRISRVFPEFGIGYYWHKPDLQVNVSYRGIRSDQKAFGETQTAKRNALSLEAYHFFTDYHGFSVFAGPCISLESLSLQQTSQTDLQKTMVRPGLIFGWDIRPNRLQVFYLRTNLRWFPGLKLNTSAGDTSFRFDQLEFNFIQVVLFPGRIF
jgi:hypothetical protein